MSYKQKRTAGYEGNNYEYRGTCPYCGSLSYFFNTEKKVGHCKKGGSLKCADQAPIFTPPIELEDTPNVIKTTCDIVRLAEYNIIQKEIYVVHRDIPESQPAYKYLKKRRVLDYDISNAELRYNKASGDLLFPIEPCVEIYPDAYIKRKVFPEVGASYISDSVPKKKGGYLFGKHSLIPGNAGIILVEGVFDVLSPHLLGYAVALMGTQLFLSQAIWLKNNYKNIIIWLDPDAVIAAKTIQTKLIDDYGFDNSNVTVFEHPGHDPGDCTCLGHIKNMINKTQSK